MTQLTHFNQFGEAHIVNVSKKASTQRTAVTEGYITMLPETLQMLSQGQHKKGDVLGIARIAGIMASKKTAELVPLCHSVPIAYVEIQLSIDNNNHRVHCLTVVKANAQTGVEMEALNATQVTLLTIYDMCKAVDRGMVIQSVQLLEKSGGKSGHWQRHSR